MRPRCVVIGDPSLDRLPWVNGVLEEGLGEQFVPHPPIEGFDVAVLHWLAGCDVVPLNAMLFRPHQHSVGRELGAVIGDDDPWLAAPLADRRQLARNPSDRD